MGVPSQLSRGIHRQPDQPAMRETQFFTDYGELSRTRKHTRLGAHTPGSELQATTRILHSANTAPLAQPASRVACVVADQPPATESVLAQKAHSARNTPNHKNKILTLISRQILHLFPTSRAKSTPSAQSHPYIRRDELCAEKPRPTIEHTPVLQKATTRYNFHFQSLPPHPARQPVPNNAIHKKRRTNPPPSTTLYLQTKPITLISNPKTHTRPSPRAERTHFRTTNPPQFASAQNERPPPEKIRPSVHPVRLYAPGSIAEVGSGSSGSPSGRTRNRLIKTNNPPNAAKKPTVSPRLHFAAHAGRSLRTAFKKSLRY